MNIINCKATHQDNNYYALAYAYTAEKAGQLNHAFVPLLLRDLHTLDKLASERFILL